MLKCGKITAMNKQGTKQQGSKFTKEQTAEKKEQLSKLLQEDKGEISIIKACEIVGISESCFYNWKEDDEEFAEKVATARSVLSALAEANVKDHIEREREGCGFVYDDKGRKTVLKPEVSQWYLERRVKEYKDKKNIEVEAGTSLAGYLNKYGRTPKGKKDK